jgi:uncharacterized membrane protein
LLVGKLNLSSVNNQEVVYILITKYLKKSNYYFSLNQIKLLLNSHPEFPSLKSITDTLDTLNVENLVANLPINSIDKLPNEFIAVLKNGELCLVVKSIKKVKLTTQSLIKVEKTISEFQNDWTGAILAVERSNSKVPKNSILKYLGLFFLLFILFYNSNFEIFITPLLSLVGLILSILILRKGLGLSDSVSQEICSKGKSVNCDSVINYKGGFILSKISFGDLSFIFFSSITIVSFFIGFDYLFYLVFLLLCIPVIFYSIFLQSSKIKQWCNLCLLVSSVILLMNTELIFNDYNLAFNSLFWKQSLSVFAIILIVWIYLKPYIHKYIELIEMELNNLKLKRNFKLFNTLLTQKKKIETSSTKKMSLGSSNPKTIVDIVISPTCSFCEKAFNVFREILDNNTHREKIQVNFIFNTKLESKDDIGRHISAQILNLNQASGATESYDAMKFWFKTKNYSKWKEKYNSIDSNNTDILIENTKWCEINNISHTPQVILNGYLYPSEFDLEDIEYQIANLVME